MSSPAPALDDRLTQAYDLAAEAVRRLDKDRWLAGLYAPEERRRHLYALYAFAIEIDRIRDVVSDPLPGEIRARWWADMLAGARGGEGDAHPIAAALLDTIARFDLPLDAFDRLIEAKIFDLYDDPMPDMAALEVYCADTSGALIRLAARVLATGGEGEIDAAAGPAGIAHGLAAMLRALPRHAVRGHILLPADLLERHGVARDDVLAGETGPELERVLAEIRDRARAALAETRRLVGAIPPAAAPAFLHVCLVDQCLERMERPDHDPFRTVLDIPQWRRQWRLWNAARRARKAVARR